MKVLKYQFFFYILCIVLALFYGQYKTGLLIAVWSIISVVSVRFLYRRLEIEHIREKEYRMMQSFIDNQRIYFEQKKEAQEKINKMHHDLKHHLTALEKISGDNIEAKHYIEEMKHAIKPLELHQNTGNPIIDALLYEKSLEAERLGIRMEVAGEPFCLSEYSTKELCTIFDTALDNAIHASRNPALKEKNIDIKITRSKAGTVLLFENKYLGKRKMEKGRFLTTKNLTKEYGMGLPGMKQAIEKLGGRMIVRLDNQIFSLFILFT